MIPTWVDLLDARPRFEAKDDPLVGSVNIPFSELPERLHELPRPTTPIRLYDPYEVVAGIGDLAGRAWIDAGDPQHGEAGRCRLWEYNSMLDDLKTPGIALDLGCGSGRDAVALACLGWSVTAVDWLPKSLEMGRDLERRYSDGSPITWLEHDLRRGAPDGEYDLVTSFFAWKPDALVDASHRLRTGGRLMIEMFTPTDKARHGKPKHPADAEEICRLFAHLRQMALNEDWRFGRHTVRYIGVRA